MRWVLRGGRAVGVLIAFGLAFFLAARFGSGNLWKGFQPALAAPSAEAPPYDLTRLEAVNQTLKLIRKRYVDPERIAPKDMLVSALNYIQREVPEVTVRHESDAEVTVQAGAATKTFRTDNVVGLWDVAARLREVFAFLQVNVSKTVDRKTVEYAACNGILHTLDPHSSFLTPEAYREMNVQTSGSFGGLGIVIAVRDEQLTVMRTMPGTPAEAAGLQKFDRITKIENESTLNMPLEDAVRRLRGDRGTPVTLWVTREGEGGFTEAKAFPMTRELIKVASVESKLLADGVGYILLKNFQSTSVDEVSSALSSFRKQGELKGLVLDLRGNPGGLLDQAVRIADLFIRDGVLVATVGAAEGREERRAEDGGTEPPYPIVVLINGSSASASEILAGALKNLDRAILVGQDTFGKGSVQLVFPELTADNAALKLTIAEYLTPGDISIQGVGISPDIELDPMTVDPEEMDLLRHVESTKERELYASIESRFARPKTPPAATLRYYYPKADRDRDRESGDSDDAVKIDFQVELAQKLAATLPASAGRDELLEKALPTLRELEARELSEVSQALSELNVDWSAPPTGWAAPGEGISVTIDSQRPGNTVTAGEPMPVKISVTNTSQETLYRVRAESSSDGAFFDDKEWVFGKIAPGETKTQIVPMGTCEFDGPRRLTTQERPKDQKRVCRIPLDAADRSDGVTFKFEAAGTPLSVPADFRPTIVSLPRPVFKTSVQVADDRGGNGDGLLQRGESVSLYLTVANVGQGESRDTHVALANGSGDGLLLRAGRFDLKSMKPGEERRVRLTFDVAKNLRDPEAVVSLSVGDRELGEFATEKFKLPVAAPTSVEATELNLEATKEVTLVESASPSARAFARIAPGKTTSAIGKVGDFYKLDLGSDRFAFARAEGFVTATSKPTGPTPISDLFLHARPDVRFTAPQTSTRQASITVSGTASSLSHLEDVYAFVGGRKVYFQRAEDGSQTLPFQFEAPLKLGINVITVFAREDSDSITRRQIIIRRDAEDGSLRASPKGEDKNDWIGL